MKANKPNTKKKKHFIIKSLIFLFIVYCSCNLTYSLLIGSSFKLTNEDFIKLLISETNHNFIYKYNPINMLNKVFSFFSNIDIKKPTTILGINFLDKDVLAAGNVTEDEDSYNPNELEKISEYIRDPNPAEVTKPRIYIYDSHQLENYNAEKLEIYNIKPNVLMAAYMLKEKLNNVGISTIVEESNMTEFMRINNWDHADSYKASRVFILDAKSKYDTLEYYIDVHRDSIKKSASTIVIDKKSYAKTLFVVGLENPNYKGNLKLANDINSIINNKYPGLSRGVLKKQGKGVDGVYNQDISPKMFLLEVGGVDNTIEEVLNTINAIADVIYTYVGEQS
jgi:stage II sporulation protein P